MKRLPYGQLVTAVLFLLTLFLISSDDVTAYFRSLMEGNALGPLAFVGIIVIAIVLAPIAALPLVPLAASLFGALVTALLSVIGYTIGATIAFLLARTLGRPVLRYFAPLEKLDAFEKKFSRLDEFVTILLLRMLVPVDILSYAVGVLTAVPLRTYVLATAIGVTPFSFIFAYGGQALAERSFAGLAATALIGGALFFFAAKFYRSRRRQHGDRNGSPA